MQNSEKKTPYEVALATQAGRPDRTNWPFPDTKAKKRKNLTTKFFVDKGGLTVAEFTNLVKALRFMEKSTGCVLRAWAPDDDEMDSIQAEKRVDMRYQRAAWPHKPLTETARPKTFKPFSKE